MRRLQLVLPAAALLLGAVAAVGLLRRYLQIRTCNHLMVQTKPGRWEVPAPHDDVPAQFGADFIDAGTLAR
ncbi:hypothetical protein ACFQYP_20975 [Nonomuraea antimicrobica]|uniref:hypothetical protein n=1 Tax=Nonomuraea antimicrobica TaxID=561173 RepID=UPI0031E8099A